jgi:hypothetical protein
MPPKGGLSKWKTKEGEWTSDLALFITNLKLATLVYEALTVTKKFRLSVDGTVLYSRGAGGTTPCSDANPLLYPGKDLEFDDHGCLRVLDKKLGKLIKDAHDNNRPFKIEVPVKATGGGGGIGEYKVNTMCIC